MVIEFSKLADQDLDDIYDYSLAQFGFQQARKYIKTFHETFELLTENPKIGSSAYGMRKFPCGVHIIFYQVRAESLFIVRVLHQGMLPERHLIMENHE